MDEKSSFPMPSYIPAWMVATAVAGLTAQAIRAAEFFSDGEREEGFQTLGALEVDSINWLVSRGIASASRPEPPR